MNCGAILEEGGFSVKILDFHALRIRPYKVKDYLQGFDKIFITSSSLDRWQCPNVDIKPFLETVGYLRGLTEEVYVMGYHGTVEPEKILDLTKAKAVIRGEPECAVLEICQNKTLSGIKGLSFREEGGLISTPTREALDMKKLPVPVFHLVDFKKYSYEIMGRNFALFETSRGCKFHCSFCNKIMYGERIRTKSREQVFEEISVAVERHNVRTGYFMDLDFLSDRETVKGLCEYLIRKKYKFKWACQARGDSLNEEILKKMKSSGCDIIHLGVETDSQKKLDCLNKNTTVDKIKNTVSLCKKTGIKTFAFFMFGLPGETARERKKILNFAEKLNTDFVSFHRLIPYKGSRICSDGPASNTGAGSFIKAAFIRYYLRPCYIFRLKPSIIYNGIRLLFGRIKTAT